MKKEDFQQKFLEDRDESGRFIVKSIRTGRSYYVEALGDPHREWGSALPGDHTGKLAVKKGWKKYRGSIEEGDSLITKDNGFAKIHNLEPGISPLAYIDMLDEQYPDK